MDGWMDGWMDDPSIIFCVCVLVCVRVRACVPMFYGLVLGLVLGLVVEGALESSCCASGHASGCARMSVRVRKSGQARACIDDDRILIRGMVSRDTVLVSGRGRAGSGRARVDVWPGQVGGFSRTPKHSSA